MRLQLITSFPENNPGLGQKIACRGLNFSFYGCLHIIINTFANQIITMYTIHINFEQKDLEPLTLSNISPDQSLLEVCLDNDIELHHNCGAVCACSTCHLYVDNGSEFI